MKAWSALWLEQAGINTIAADVEENADGTIASLTLTQSAPAEHPVLRPHRLAVGFYNEDPATGRIVRTDRIELDVDGETTVVTEAAGKPRPAFILVNDDDLTYTKLRFDAASLEFAGREPVPFRQRARPCRDLAGAVGYDPRRRTAGRAVHRDHAQAACARDRVHHVPLRAELHGHHRAPLRGAGPPRGRAAPCGRRNCGRWRTPPKPVPTTSSSSSTPTWATAKRATPNSPRTCAACSTAP